MYIRLVGTTAKALELPRWSIGYLFNEYRLVDFYIGSINKGQVYHGYRERLSFAIEIDKEVRIPPT